MLRMLQAFVWIRWRMLVNSLEHTGSRDVIQRFSLAAEKLGPIVAAVLLVPSVLVLFALSLAAGYALGSSAGTSVAFEAARYLLMPVPALAVLGPLFLPAADRTNPVRLLLLPIPASTLYLAQSASALGDLWNILMLPILVGVPLGLAASGAFTGAIVALVAALLLLVVVIGLASLATSILHLVVRDRRRGEIAALIFIVVVPVVGMIPGLLGSGGARRGQAAPWVGEVTQGVASVYPAEVFARAVRATAAGDQAAAGSMLLRLGGSAALLHAAGLLLFGRVLQQPGSAGRRTAAASSFWERTLPGLSPGASAIAMAQLRLAIRTPRGRSIFLSPVAILLIFGVMMSRGSGTMDFGTFRLSGGISLATFTSIVSMLALLPISMNQFAVDRAGLTLVLLSPLDEGDLLIGKAVGNALVAAVPVSVTYVGALLMMPAGSPFLWLSLLLALPSIYMVTAPAAAVFSAVFPRAVDMNSVGGGSNAHGAAGLLGLLAFLIAAVPPALLTLAAFRLFDRPNLAPLFLLLWCVVTFFVGRLLFIPARRVFSARRENLARVV